MTGANAVVAVRPVRRSVAARLSQRHRPVSVVFIAADAVGWHRDELRLPRDYSVTDASTVEAASALSQTHPPDLVILDLGQLALEGLATLRRLQADPCLGNAPLVLFGAFDDLSALREGMRLGARDYLIRGETTPSLVARRVWSWIDGPAKQPSSGRSTRPGGAAPAPLTAPDLPPERTGLIDLFGGSLVGLVVLLLKQTLLLVVDRDGKRA